VVGGYKDKGRKPIPSQSLSDRIITRMFKKSIVKIKKMQANASF
jgi:hypothetical protein